MALLETLQLEVDKVLRIDWQIREENAIPESEEIAPANGAFKIEAAFLYADLADVTVLAEKCSWEITAKIIRAYLDISARLILAHGGAVRSAGGHRVMGIFRGESPNTSAVNCARKIDWMVEKVLNPKAGLAFPSIRNNKLAIRHCIGIDTSDAWAVRSGGGINSGLIWIGRAPEFAAQLSGIGKYPYSVYTSRNCFVRLSDIARKTGEANIWFEIKIKVGDETHTVYRTNGMLRP
ncbi:MAG: adenylate/guanylate cyclase domain-containing protein [Ginsengibacter sp.]